ncbi:MAG TPA: hypothetical protein VFU31_08590 [Candidatus Binatia bacterium]|nr:hypothetical protein [Candidatus Binatia bacterium]
MSKILVIEPHRILQQAISLSLFPDHEVQIMASMPDAALPKEFDLVILDAASLRAKDALGSATSRWLQNWGGPVVWLDHDDGESKPQREKLIVIQSPLNKERLLAAVAESLGLLSPANSSVAIEPGKDSAAGRKKRVARARETDAVAEQENVAFIELVDVVDEEPEGNATKSPPKTSK